MNSVSIKPQHNLCLACILLSIGDTASFRKHSPRRIGAAELLKEHQSFYLYVALINWSDLPLCYDYTAIAFVHLPKCLCTKEDLMWPTGARKSQDLLHDNELNWLSGSLNAINLVINNWELFLMKIVIGCYKNVVSYNMPQGINR